MYKWELWMENPNFFYLIQGTKSSKLLWNIELKIKTDLQG